MTTLEEFQEVAPAYVAAGAEWLDENEPGWERRIDLAILDLGNSCRCVLGQVTPERSYVDALVRICHLDGWGELDPGLPRRATAVSWAVRHGFNGPGCLTQAGPFAPAYGVLDELWIALIKSRFSDGTLSQPVESEDV